MQYVFHGKPSTSVRSGQPVNVDALYPLDKMGQQLFYEKFADKLTTEINPAFVGGFQPRGTSVYPVSLFHIQHRQIYLFNHSKIHKDMRQFKALTAYITFVKGQAYRVTTAPIDLQRFSASEAPSIPANLDVEATLARQVMRAMRKPIVFGVRNHLSSLSSDMRF